MPQRHSFLSIAYLLLALFAPLAAAQALEEQKLPQSDSAEAAPLSVEAGKPESSADKPALNVEDSASQHSPPIDSKAEPDSDDVHNDLHNNADQYAEDSFGGESAAVDDSPAAQEPEIIIDSIQALFSVLSASNKRNSYQSLITYEANGLITTYKLKHQVKEGGVEEQLMFMDGPKRQVVRQQALAHCQQGVTRWGLWPSSIPTNSLLGYQLKVQRLERIANRETIVFDIIPNDSSRYGYRYNVDKETGLVLKSVTYHNDAIIERLQTVSIGFDLDLNGEQNSDSDSDFAWRVPEVEPCFSSQFTPAWKVNWLPEGFDYVGNRLTAQGEQVLIFADGLTSVSIFIVKNKAPLTKVSAQHGATVVVVAPVASRPENSIAVVGEIPIATARKIAVSVKPL